MSDLSRHLSFAHHPRRWSHPLAVLAILASLSLLIVATLAQQARANTTDGLMRMDDVESGTLLLHSTEPGKYVPAPLLATDVKLDVTGLIARTRVTQHFINPGDGWVEGKYVFPLPEDSAVDTLKMVIGERVIEGQIKEKEEARRAYEEARDNGQKASLVEQQRPNVFTNSVANIGPKETIIIQIEYQQTVRRDSEAFSLRFPMVVAPRYTPRNVDPQLVDFTPGEGGWGTVIPQEPKDHLEQPPVQHPDDGPLNPVSLSVTLDVGFPLGDVVSSHHAITLTRNSDDARKANIHLAKDVVPANKDFELVWKPASMKAPTAALFKERVGDEDYLLVMLAPPSGDVLPEAKPREAILVIDNSGSMAGPSMVQAKESLLFALDRLTPRDTFNVIRFDHSMEMLFPSAVPAHGENLDVARKFVRSLEAEGGTEMLPALRAALQDRNAKDSSRVRQIVFLTDGAISNERELFTEITSGLGRSRLFTVGIGSAPNSYFMARAAEAGRGTFTHIGSEEQVTARMSELFEKLESPIMTNITATWPDGRKTESWPNPIPDLYKGEPIILSARIAEAKGTLTLQGEVAGKPWKVNMPISAGETRPGIGKLWARRKIEQLEADVRIAGNWNLHDDEILQVALEHHLVSRRTSLVAIDITPSRPDSERLTRKDMPVNLPEGWEYEKVFGPATGQAVPARFAAASPRLALAVAPAPAADMAATGIALPQTATDAPALIRNGLVALLIAASLALFWWVQRRRAKA